MKRTLIESLRLRYGLLFEQGAQLRVATIELMQQLTVGVFKTHHRRLSRHRERKRLSKGGRRSDRSFFTNTFQSGSRRLRSDKPTRSAISICLIRGEAPQCHLLIMSAAVLHSATARIIC
jgi:hypothetical protein